MRNVSRRTNEISLITFGALLAMGAQIHSATAADKWLACTGTVTAIEEKGTKTDPSSRVIAYNDELKALYQWQEQKKALNLIPSASFTGDRIKWGKPNALGYSS